MRTRLRDGREVETIEIAAGGLRARLSTLGAALAALEVPDREGRSVNVVLGYRDPDAHLDHPVFLGAVVGRFANRIARGRFLLDGQAHQLTINDPPNHLHGGTTGFHARLWTLEGHDGASACFALTSADSDNGYPGRLEARARYTIGEDGLTVELDARCDAPTVCNLSHHPYWNLGGEAAAAPILDHWLAIAASRFTPVDASQIPTGALREAAGPFDFRAPKPVGRDIGAEDAQLGIGAGYDHNWAIDGWDGQARKVATLFHPDSGRVLELSASQPGLQFYSGNHLAGTPAGTSGRPYAARAGLCLEPQCFPDAPNQPSFPSARLDPGERYSSVIRYRFRTAESVAEAFA